MTRAMARALRGLILPGIFAAVAFGMALASLQRLFGRGPKP